MKVKTIVVLTVFASFRVGKHDGEDTRPKGQHPWFGRSQANSSCVEDQRVHHRRGKATPEPNYFDDER